MRLAVLDIGSNTAHMVVVDGHPDGTFTTVGRDRELLRIADAAFPAMVLPVETADRLVRTVTRMRRFAEGHSADTILGFATSAIREATNGIEVLARVRDEAGVLVKVLPGAEEGRLTYAAARKWTTFSAKWLLVLDIGGGSLEVTGGDGERPEFAESLPLGATRLTRRFLHADPPDSAELAALRVHALTLLGPLAERVRRHDWDVVCATSKTFRTLGRVAEALPSVASPSDAFGFAGIDGTTAPMLTAETVNLLAGHLAKTSARDRRKLKGLDELRAGNVLAGSQIAALATQAFGLKRLVLAPWALREGVIIEYLQRNATEVEAPADDRGRIATVVDFANRYSWDEAHCRHVTKLALALFDQTAEMHGLGAAERELLEAAGLLHDVGAAVGQSAHHKHSMYIIRNAELQGFTQRELLLMANIARYHRKALPAEHHHDYVELEDDDRRLVRRLAALLRLADGLDLDHFQVVEDVTLHSSNGVVDLQLRARDEPRVALWASEHNGDLFEAEFQRPLRPQVVSVL